MSILTDKEQKVIALRGQGKTLEEIGKDCIELLKVSGENTKEKVRNKLMEMVEKY